MICVALRAAYLLRVGVVAEKVGLLQIVGGVGAAENDVFEFGAHGRGDV